VTQVQLDAWLYINRQKFGLKRLPKRPVSDVEHDYRVCASELKRENIAFSKDLSFAKTSVYLFAIILTVL